MQCYKTCLARLLSDTLSLFFLLPVWYLSGFNLALMFQETETHNCFFYPWGRSQFSQWDPASTLFHLVCELRQRGYSNQHHQLQLIHLTLLWNNWGISISFSWERDMSRKLWGAAEEQYGLQRKRTELAKWTCPFGVLSYAVLS